MKEREFERTVNLGGLRITVAGSVDESGTAGIDQLFDIQGGGAVGTNHIGREVMNAIQELLDERFSTWSRDVLAEEEKQSRDEEDERECLPKSNEYGRAV